MFFFINEQVWNRDYVKLAENEWTRLICQWIIRYEVQCWNDWYQRYSQMLTNITELKRLFWYGMIYCKSSWILKQSYHFATDFNCLQLQLVDILNTLHKYRVSYKQLTFITEMFEPLVKSCAKFYLLIVNMQRITACSLYSLNCCICWTISDVLIKFHNMLCEYSYTKSESST